MDRAVNELGLLALLIAALFGALGGGGAVGLYALNKLRLGAEDLPRWPYVVSSAIFGTVAATPAGVMAFSVGRPLEEVAAVAIFSGAFAVSGVLGVQALAIRHLRAMSDARFTASGIFEQRKNRRGRS